MDVLVGVFRLKEQELGDDQVRLGIVDRGADEKDSVLQEAREDVVRSLSTARLLDHHRNQVHARTPFVQARVTRLTPSTTLARSYRKLRAFRSSSRLSIPSRRPSRRSISRKAAGSWCKAAAKERISSFN